MVHELIQRALLAADEVDCGAREAVKKERMRAVMRGLANDMYLEDRGLSAGPMIFFNSNDPAFQLKGINKSVSH